MTFDTGFKEKAHIFHSVSCWRANVTRGLLYKPIRA